MTHSRSCTKQKVLLIYSLQSDYIKYVLCCAYYGMRRAITHCCLFAAGSEHPATPRPPISCLTCAGRGKRAKKWCLLSVTPLNRSHLPSWIFPPSFSSLFACTCSHISHFAVPVPSVTLSWLLKQPPWGHYFNFHAFDCGVCLTENPPWLRHQPGAS